MPALAQADAPVRRFDIAGVETLVQQIGDALEPDLAARQILGVSRLALQEALRLCLAFEATGGEALQRFLNDRGKRFIPNQHLAFATTGLIAITLRRLVPDIVTLLQAGFHLLDGLATILLALQLALGGHDRLDEGAFRCVLEGEVQTLDTRAAGLELLTQLDVEDRIAGKALQIIEDHGVVFARLGIKEAQQCHHAGALHEVAATRDIIGEDGLDIIPPQARILPAAMFLAVQPGAFGLLFGR